LHAAASEALFFRSLSAVQPLDGIVSELLLYSNLILARQVDQNTGLQFPVGAAMYSDMAVIQLHQEGRNHTYMPLN
jgi:hypothetical protein